MADPIKVMTPEGRLINHSLFEKDQYVNERGQKAEPGYKLELALEDDDALKELEDAIYEVAIAEWGEEAEAMLNDGRIKNPLRSGDDMAAEREKKGKQGDAYKGKVVIRATTKFNRHGEDAAGGVYVCGPDANELTFEERSKAVYRGCYGVAVVQPVAYKVENRGVTLYLHGFQKTRDGEPLRGSDPSSLFSPMMGAGSEGKGRRARK